MASNVSRNGKAGMFEPMDKLPSNTLKRHPKMDLNKNDLLRLLSYLEGELQGRDITIAALKAEKAKQLLYQAKYGRFGLGDPFLALQRDSDSQKDNSFDEAAVKVMYDNQLAQLENLIETQRRAQHRMREQLAAVEKRYHKSCADLEDEKRKHAQDTAQGDDVTYMLEKDRERLKQEVDFEKGQVKKLDKEVKKLTASLEEERAASAKHKQVALMLIKERKKIMEHMVVLQHRNSQMQSTLKDEKGRMKNFAEGLAEESRKSVQIEASMEKQLAEFDVERKHLKQDLAQEEQRSKELGREVEHLRGQIEQMQKQFGAEKRGDGPQSIEIKSTAISGRSPVREVGVVNQIEHGIPSQGHMLNRAPPVGPQQQHMALHRNTPPNTPPELRKGPAAQNMRDSPERDYVTSWPMGQAPVQDPNMKKGLTQMSNANIPNRPTDRTPLGEKPVPAEKPAELSARGLGGGTSTAVLTMPSGTRISLNVGPSPNQPRKALPVGRGVPPPVPPNKPQVVLPPSPNPRKETPVRALAGVAVPLSGPPGGRPQPPSKVITISKDKILVSHPDSRTDNMRHLNTSNQRPVGSSGTMTAAIAPPGAGGDSGPPAVRKPSQLMFSDSDCTPDTSPNLEYFGPEMADLQHLLVSMVTGSSEGSTSSIVDASPTSPPTSSALSASLLSYPMPPSSLLLFPDALAYPLHRHSVGGDVAALHAALANKETEQLINQPMRDGTTAVHCAAEAGYQDCLGLLLQHGGDPNALRQDQVTPLHLAAGDGQTMCVKMLLEHGAHIDQTDHSSWTALHWAATNGYSHCCRMLLEYGARIDAKTSACWTPLHAAIHSNYAQCLEVLLTMPSRPANQETGTTETNQWQQSLLHDVINMCDKDGWTVAHLAAAKDTKDCLEVLLQHCEVNLGSRDKWDRTVTEVASQTCKEYLDGLDLLPGSHSVRCCTVCVEIPGPISTQSPETTYAISTLCVGEQTTWSELEEGLADVWARHVSEVTVGLKTRKTARLDVESPESATHFTLGLSQNSVKHYSLGFYHWSPGTRSDKQPSDILSAGGVNHIGIRLFGLDDGCQDALAYESLLPVPFLQNYMRLLDQYRNLILYGPGGTGKTYLSRKLARCLQAKEVQSGNSCSIHFITLTPQFSRSDLNRMLVNKGCLLPARFGSQPHYSPVLVFDDFSQINVSEVFKDILPIMEVRGPSQPTPVQLDEHRAPEYHYLHTNCYILGTMDVLRSTGLPLAIQQRLRWVHLRQDQEPIRHLLQRHLYRQLLHSHSGRLPGPDTSVYKAVEWTVCIWQRLNEGLAKLGLQDLVFGPSRFLNCPVEVNKSKAILRWLILLWNHAVAPLISEAVIKGSGSETGMEGQQKVAKTALYVLIQRALVPGCPLAGQEKERYLSSFYGSNELAIKMRREGRGHGSTFSGDDDQSPEGGSTEREGGSPVEDGRKLHDKQNQLQKRKPFGSAAFAVAGFPASLEDFTPIDQAPPPPPQRTSTLTQSDEDLLRQRVPLRAGPRTYTTQPLPRNLVPVHDPRRALSPGPEMRRSEQIKAEHTRRAISPGPGQGLSSTGDPMQARRGRMSEANQQKRREFFQDLAESSVVSPNKLPTFPSVASK